MVPLLRLKTSVVGAIGLKAQKMGSKGSVGTGPVGLAPTPTPRAATYSSCAARPPRAAAVTTAWGSSAVGMRPTSVQSSPGVVFGPGRRIDRDLVGARLGHEEARALAD